MPRGDQWPHVISGRFSNTEGTLLAQLRATTEENTWTAALRWILTDPTCRERIDAKIRGEA